MKGVFNSVTSFDSTSQQTWSALIGGREGDRNTSDSDGEELLSCQPEQASAPVEARSLGGGVREQTIFAFVKTTNNNIVI